MATEQVINPSHYDVMPGVTAIDIIAATLTEDQFYGYCLGNALKYRLRAGKKTSDPSTCLHKADNHMQLFNDLKHLCRKESLQYA